MPRSKVKLKVLSSMPCTQPWSAMQGNQRERHCAACDKHVHNFAAMTARQIEQLVGESQGRLCARVAYRPDGSIRTLDGHSQPSVAAGVVLAASLAFGASAGAESPGDTSAKATLAGTILATDGPQPFAGAFVSLRSGGQTVAMTRTDERGNFAVSAAPGRYDISIGRNVFFGLHIRAADLHEGEQSLPPIHFSIQAESVNMQEFTTGGAMVATYSYPISYLFKHPIRYLKHLPHNF